MAVISVDGRNGVYLSLGFFFFQAEDGIRDHCVTGVQTCALPISMVGIATAAEPSAPRSSTTWARSYEPISAAMSRTRLSEKVICFPPTVWPPSVGFAPFARPLIPVPKVVIDLPVTAYV